jgi:hypothetical protein
MNWNLSQYANVREKLKEEKEKETEFGNESGNVHVKSEGKEGKEKIKRNKCWIDTRKRGTFFKNNKSTKLVCFSTK